MRPAKAPLLGDQWGVAEAVIRSRAAGESATRGASIH